MNTSQCPECLSTNVGTLDPADQTIDCLDCGIWREADHPNNQPGSPMWGKALPDDQMTKGTIGPWDGVPIPDRDGHYDCLEP